MCASTTRLPRRQWYVTCVPLASVLRSQASSPSPSISSSLVTRPVLSPHPREKALNGAISLWASEALAKTATERLPSLSLSCHLFPASPRSTRSAVCLFSSTRRGSVDWAFVRESDETG